MKLATPLEMNNIDSHAINCLGIPGIVLMENAALRVVEAATEMLGGLDGRQIVILAGKGNNGGDALAAARHLHNRGASCSPFLLSAAAELRGDAAVNLKIISSMGLQVDELIEDPLPEKLNNCINNADLVIDGIFGTGLKGNVKGVAASIIEAVNRSLKLVLSIDIPSGICGETGKILGSCINASRTVTFCLPKVGLVVHPGCDHTGRLDVVDIGIPAASVMQSGIRACVTDRELVSGMLSPRAAESNKGDYGKIFILTGSKGMTGSGCLSANAALRTGAGLVYLGVPEGLAHIYGSAISETVLIPLADDGSGKLTQKSIPAIMDALKGKNAVAAGPGLSVNEDIIEIVKKLLSECSVPLILDADALNAISQDINMLKGLKTDAVITPHPAEMARLTGLTVNEVMGDRTGTARNFSEKWGVITVLKGSRTVIAMPDGSCCINTTGNPGMATGGSGDLLTGIIASLAGQGMKPADAAVAGVYLHGLAGDAAARELGEHGMLPRDMAERLPFIIKEIFGGG